MNMNPNTTYTVVAENCGNHSTKIIEDDKVDQWLKDNGLITNIDGSEWGQFEVVSKSGLTLDEALAFCKEWAGE